MNKIPYPRGGRVADINLKDFHPTRTSIPCNGGRMNALMRVMPAGNVWCLADGKVFGTGRSPEHAFQNYQYTLIKEEAERRMEAQRLKGRSAVSSIAQRVQRMDEKLRQERRSNDRAQLQNRIARYVRGAYDSRRYDIFDVFPVDDCDAVILLSARQPEEKPWCVRYLGRDETFVSYQEAMSHVRKYLPARR